MPKAKKGKKKAKKGKKAPAKRGGKDTSCRRCGAPTEGKAAVCLECAAKEALGVSTDTSSKRVAQKVKEGLAEKGPGTCVCPFCRTPLDWENVGQTEAEITIYVREKIYYCPSCRAFLGVSSWHPGG